MCPAGIHSELFARSREWLGEPVKTGSATPQEQMARVFGYVKGLHATHLIDLGVRLRLFDELRLRGEATPHELAEWLGTYAPYTQIWCEAACALELLDHAPPGGYRLAPGIADVLGDENGAQYLGAFPHAHLQIARDYGRYEDLFRSGGAVPYSAHDRDFLAAVASATRVLPRMCLSTVLPELPDLQAELQSGARILDVGCGAGYAVIEFAQRFPRVTCVGIDSDPVSVQMASDLVVRGGLEERAVVEVGDGANLPLDYAGQFDLVTMFVALHEIEPPLKARVIQECHRVLKPGGTLLVFDERYPSRPTDLRDPAQIYAVMAQWYELTWGNEIVSREAIRDLLGGERFAVRGEYELSRFYVVVAERGA